MSIENKNGLEILHCDDPDCTMRFWISLPCTEDALRDLAQRAAKWTRVDGCDYCPDCSAGGQGGAAHPDERNK